MITKAILFTLIAACGVSAGAASNPDKQPPAGPPEEDGYIFCCKDVDPKTETGEDCVTIGEKQIDSCSTVLACDTFTKKDGKVTCT